MSGKLKRIVPDTRQYQTPVDDGEVVRRSRDEERPPSGQGPVPAAPVEQKVTEEDFTPWAEAEQDDDSVGEFYESLRAVNPWLPSLDYVLAEPLTLEIVPDGLHALNLTVLVALPSSSV